MNGTNFKKILIGGILALTILMIFGLLWAFVLGPQNSALASGSLGWYLFSYAMGLTMIVLPCTLPLAFVIVPMVLKKGAGKGFGLALAFGLGVAITLSLYGILAAVVGKLAIGSLATPLETVKNWVYFIAGIFAYLFALSEVGLMKFHMPTYKGAAPAFIQKQGDYLKALLLGLFLGNIGVGCPHPATPLILTEIASSGDIFYGWTLFLVHALGRIIPLLILAFLAILGVNALSWLVARKDKLERATGWAMVFVAGFILTLGLFTHDWWVNSGQHTLLESITQEELLTGKIAAELGVGNAHTHGLETGAGLFGLPLSWGNWFMVFLWALPLWWYYKKKREESMEKNLLENRFWTYIFLTLLFIVTFVYYLPTRFLLQAQMPHADEMTSGHNETVYREVGAVTTGLKVNLLTLATSTTVGVPTELRFFVGDEPSGLPAPNYVLEIEHEKLMHVIGVRDDLEEFFHIHPQPIATPGIFNVNHTFTAPGNYKVWSEIKQGGIVHTFGHTPFLIEGSGVRPIKNHKTDFSRLAEVAGYKVALSFDEPIIAGREYDLTFSISASGNQPVALDNYLGAEMHLAIIKDDWSQFIHTHPTDDNHPHSSWPFEFISRALANGDGHGDEVNGHVDTRPMETGLGVGIASASIPFVVNFPTPGLYRAFAQFRPADANLAPDDYLLASFWIEVKETGQTAAQTQALIPSRTFTDTGAGSGTWWSRLLISILAIVGLSLLVRHFLKIKTV
ncbi:MAG: cytochrome c biogenesis protein CcdA [Patescibacteria group bacterium]